MIQVVNVDEMQKIEKQTFLNQNITSFELMQKVGKSMYQTFKEEHDKDNILLIVSTGNNGGDALVFGEQAFLEHKHVETIIIGEQEKQSNEFALMIKRFMNHGLSFTYVDSFSSFINQIKDISNVDLIVDGLFGIGLSRDITGVYKEVIKWINKQKTDILSIDMPSGLHADTGKIMGISVKPTITYTIEAIKQGLLLEDAMDVTRNIEIIDVGMSKIINNKYYIDTFHLPPKRAHNTHKYDYKNVITIGGQIGVMGAITLAGYSALVSGAGLSTVLCNQAYENHMIRPYPELMYEVIKSKEDLSQIMMKKDAVLFGLGMRKITDFEKMIFEYITELEIPLVLDAMGMLFLKEKKVIKNKRVVITPHYGEFSKLMDISVDELKQDPIRYLNQCIKTYDCEIILKGPSTIYATKDQVIYLNHGIPALAKAGSGDVLAGIILTYVARNLDVEQGILLHMLSAKKAVIDKHEESLLASDIIKQIPNVYKSYHH